MYCYDLKRSFTRQLVNQFTVELSNPIAASDCRKQLCSKRNPNRSSGSSPAEWSDELRKRQRGGGSKVAATTPAGVERVKAERAKEKEERRRKAAWNCMLGKTTLFVPAFYRASLGYDFKEKFKFGMITLFATAQMKTNNSQITCNARNRQQQSLRCRMPSIGAEEFTRAYIADDRVCGVLKDIEELIILDINMTNLNGNVRTRKMAHEYLSAEEICDCSLGARICCMTQVVSLAVC
ncbi:hypothetical protein BJ138DRAFT_1103811 [Hygrophoropsis aurantiaca]|uniref:Uncharacterized protein n=1 Tax=Hygrophoropsis aurantiaca TaxID=72124 RepID=A0ACB8A4V4_9AGAM|nr:hypothetical protein BJ138DRAFT_1103811 [Hygrophoropsis aurantiaca]